jgi:hypothetical protein
LNQYWAYDRWNEVYELNGVEFAVRKNANQMKDEEWAKLCPVHLLVSCLPAKKFDPKRHQPARREVGRRPFSEGGTRVRSRLSVKLFIIYNETEFLLVSVEYEEAFFNFFHVKNCIERNNEETPLLWAVENVASYHITVSRFEILYWKNY